MEEHGAAPIVWIPFLNRGDAPQADFIPHVAVYRHCRHNQLSYPLHERLERTHLKGKDRNFSQLLQAPTSHLRSDDARGRSQLLSQGRLMTLLEVLWNVVCNQRHMQQQHCHWLTTLLCCRLEGLVPPAVEPIELQAER